MKKVLYYKKDYHENFIKSLEDFGALKIQAKELISKLTKNGVKITYDELDNEKQWISPVIDYWERQWKENSAFKDVSLLRYFDFIQLDTTPLKIIEQKYKELENTLLIFYETNNPFYSWAENLKSNEKNEIKFPAKVYFKRKDLVEISGNSVKVNLSKRYFTVYVDNQKQLDKIEAIELFINTYKENFKLREEGVFTPQNERLFNVFIELCKPYVSDLSSDLSDLKINYNQIKRIR